MYARVIRFVLGPDRQWEAEHIADVLASITLNQVGCQGFEFFADHYNGEYQTASFWDTKDHWEASFSIVWPQFLDMIGDDFQWKPVVQMFEMYQPRLLSISKQ